MGDIQKIRELKELLRDSLLSEPDWRRQKILGLIDELACSDEETALKHHDTIYAAIIHKLAQEFFRIFYVDINTDRYLEYDPDSPDPELDMEHIESDFFLQNSKGMFETLFEDDVESFRAAFKKDKILRTIKDHGEFSLIYRVKHHGGYSFVNMKGTRIDGDEGHIVVGVKNIDADVRREKEYLMNLAQAKDEANRDGLTGIRNRHAYLEYVAELDRGIESGEVTSYAILVFDINGLKTVNDTLGHQAGDKYIREGCNSICKIFRKSPVFRIGGDEFVVVAQGDDLSNLECLIDQVELMNRRNQADGGVVIAVGSAKAGRCRDIRSVFERADELMYEDKKRLKGLAGQDGSRL